ncbi:MAG: T9SS type A sorting domain-containing protein [Chitinophagales bacterium]
MLLGAKTFAQPAEGKEWAVGYGPSVLVFEGDSTYNYRLDSSYEVLFLTTVASMCDTEGKLMFFSNGVTLINSKGDTIENGYNFHPPELEQFYDGLANSSQEALILPRGGGEYYYLHYSMSDYNWTHNKPFDLLYYSVVDMAANNNAGKVVQKCIPLLSNATLAPYGLTACRHANGRDWWLIMPETVKNSYYEFLVTPDSIYGPLHYDVSTGFFGTVIPHGQCAFSNQGDALATTNFDGGVKVMHFDRCNGVITPWLGLTVPYDSATQYGIGGCGTAFSASGRFLYVNTFKKVYQFDLQDTNVQQSVLMVGQEDSGHYTMFDPMQIGPNGKIYISNFGGFSTSLNVIHKPDEKGLACNFVYCSDTIYGSASVVGVPNVVNFALGAQQGSGCDTLSEIRSVSSKEKVRVYPNPADDVLVIEIDNKNNSAGYLELTDVWGQHVTRYNLLPLQQKIQLSTADLLAGNYFYFLHWENARRLAKGRFTVVH